MEVRRGRWEFVVESMWGSSFSDVRQFLEEFGGFAVQEFVNTLEGMQDWSIGCGA